MTSQQAANALLRQWQLAKAKGLPPADRLNDNKSDAEWEADLAPVRQAMERR